MHALLLASRSRGSAGSVAPSSRVWETQPPYSRIVLGFHVCLAQRVEVTQVEGGRRSSRDAAQRFGCRSRAPGVQPLACPRRL